MKQHITEAQFHELTDKQKARLWEWVGPRDYLRSIPNPKLGGLADKIYPLLSIGQMIEFLQDHGKDHYTLIHKTAANGYTLDEPDEYGTWDKPPLQTPEFCDALWEACKEVLDEEE